MNMEDNSEEVKIGKAIHEERNNRENTELAIENIRLDKLTGEYLTELKKSDADPVAAKWQLLYYLKVLKEKLEDDKDHQAYYIFKYLYHFLQAMDTNKELKYILGYVSKAAGFVKPEEFVFEKEEQFLFESIFYTAMVLYESGAPSKTKIAEAHKRFENKIEHKREEKMSRTLELNTYKIQALKELGYTEINEKNASEVLEKIAEIQSRKVTN